MSARAVGVVGALAVIAVAGWLHIEFGHSAAATVSLPVVAQGSAADDCPRCARLEKQVENLQQKLTALQTQLASQQSSPAAQRIIAAAEPHTDLNDIEAARAADAEQQRAYVEGIAQSFNHEKTNSAWAGYVSNRVNAAMSTDEAFRDIGHKVECRQQTCRVELDDDGSGNLSRRLPFVALGLADVLPSAAVAPINRDSGRNTMVLYMSSRQPAPQEK